MVPKEYRMAYKEVIEILKHVPEEDVLKIPKEKLDFYKQNMDNNYEYKIDEEKEFENQDMLEETKAILAVIFRDYWANPYQREKILTKENQELAEIEEEKRKTYNPDDIFKNRNNYEIKDEKEEENAELINNNLPAEIKKESFFTKLLNYIRYKILKIKE